MLQVTYKSGEVYRAEFSVQSQNIVRLTGDIPACTSGFTLSRIGHDDRWDYSEYTTIYRQGDGFVEFSNDGSVYVEPEPSPEIEPITPGKSYDERITALENQIASYETAYQEGVNEA